LWIAWTADEVERSEPLCRLHRKYVFERYPCWRRRSLTIQRRDCVIISRQRWMLTAS
jgi:hypothetical protein